MNLALRGKKVFAISLIIAMVCSCFGMNPAVLNAAAKQVTLVGDLQSELTPADAAPGKDWDPASTATQMVDQGDGLYVFTGTLPAGTYQYKIALNGTWDESYGFDKYTNPQGTDQDGNIKITLPDAAKVTFYYNDITKKIADSTYYTPIAGDQLPRVVGTVQTALGDVKDSSPADAKTLLTDPDFDNIYSKVVEIPKGNYNYQVYVPGAAEADSHAYPDTAENLSLESSAAVTFTYNAKDHAVKATAAASEDPGTPDGQVGSVPAGNIRIHYARKDNDYTGQSLWIFDDVKTPSSGDFPAGATPFPEGQTDSYGAYIDIPVKDGAKKVSFVVVNRSTNIKDGGNKTFTILSPEFNEAWIKQGDDNVYLSPTGKVPNVFMSAGLAGTTKLALTFSITDGLKVDELKTGVKVKDKDDNELAVKNVVIASKHIVEVETDAYNLDQAPLTVQYLDKTLTTTSDWRYLDAEYNYTGDDLGATYHADKKTATLKLWAPKASTVTVDVYDKSDADVLVKNLELTKGEQGVWSIELTPESLGGTVTDVRGYFYQYQVTNKDVTSKVLDPYAKSMAVFTVDTKGDAGAGGDTVGKAAIVDLSQTNPESFDYANIEGYKKREDAVVYEVHIRDFTSDPTIVDSLSGEKWGSYNAFEKKLDYLKSLGVTHIQLLPVMAWYYGDETKMNERDLNYSNKGSEYNWGYDPHNYFSPDGAYSVDPKDPELRIKELKGLIDAVHNAGMGVVLDVVYTHMAQKEALNDIVPNYYHYIDPTGKFIGGFSNNLATNHKMAEKLMVDSVKYWFKEYKIDGMRWDMMGDGTAEAVQNALDAAKEINPNALFIGEGWRTFGGHDAEPDLKGKAADQDWMDKTDDLGVFSDEFRNELKSGYGSEGQPRFITGGARSISSILNNIKGQPSNVKFDDPGDIVPYIEAHDNLTLHDVIAQSIKKDPSIPENDLEIHKRIRLGNMLVFTSQGTAFLHAGQEYGRTKQWKGSVDPADKDRATLLKDEEGNSFGYFIHDSYDSSDAVNMFDWTKATDKAKFPVETTTRKYTSGLIELRKSTNAFRLGDQSLVNSNVTLVPSIDSKSSDLIIGYKNKSTDGTGNYYVFMNGDSTSRTITLNEDLTSGSVLVDDDQAGVTAIQKDDQSGFTLKADSITLEPLTAVIIKQEAAAAKLTSLVPDSRYYSLQVNGTHQTTVVAKYDDGSKASVTGTATYVSSNPEVATVNDKGLVKAIGLGTATITISYGGKSKTVTVSVNPKRFVELTYTRKDGDYREWNLWVWNTGVKNDQINFSTIKDGKASVLIEVASNATNVGFVLRKGTDWATAKQDFPDDRYIQLTPGEMFTKVNVISKVEKLDIKPANTGPVMKDGNITFIYRDDELFEKGAMKNISDVKVKVNGNEYPMEYEEGKEWFSYKLTEVRDGDNNYSFLVTKDGNTTEITDPKNTVNNKSVLVYHKPTVKISAAVKPGAVTANQNAVLTVQAKADLEGVSYREGTLDLSALGGPAEVKFDTALMKQTISVKDNVPAGIKTIPITIVDQYGNAHHHSTTVEVKARTYTGGKLDFDWDEARIYFALTDRFKDGDATNNFNVDKSHPEAYHGGDFRGMIDNLDYIKELGINTLWITPIVDNIDFNKGADFDAKQYGYHGYWAKDFTQLDEHLGDMATFKELINKAHDRGIKVMVDVVLNHTGYGLKPDDDDYPTITAEDKARFNGMLRTDNAPSDVDQVKGELAFLPDLITEDPAVRKQVIDWQTGWLNNARTERGDTVDYFRVDTVKHVEGTTWKAFKNALTSIDPNFKLVGEYFGGTIENNGDMLQTGQMDGLLDFGFKDAAKNFTDGKINDTDAYLQDRESKLDNTKTMAQFLSSHDENGFLTEYVDGDKGKLKIAAALQITAKGQPVIYYGEELGNSGKKEGDMSKGQFSENRSDMPWDKLTTEKALHDHYQKLLNIRAKYSKVFSKGTRTKLAGTDDLGYLAFSKHYGSEDVVTVINTKTTQVSATFAVPFAANALVKDEYSGKTYTVSADRKVTVNVPGKDDGGTVILATAQVSTPGNPTGPTTPSVPSDSQVVNESSLKNGKDGKVEVEIAQGKKSVLLPIQAAKALGTNDLTIKSGSLNVTLPSEVLSTIQGMVSGAEADGAQIAFEANPLNTSSANTTVDGLQKKGAKVSLASDVYEFKLNIIKKDGTNMPVTTFKEPITVAIKVKGNPNKDLLGVHYLADNGIHEYVGGVLNGDVLTAQVKHFSKYAALEIDKSFADVPASHWASAAVKSLTAKQVVTGVTDTKYQPNSNVSRAEFTALLTRALGLQTEEHAAFADVKPGAWYAAYVNAAVKAGIVNGRSKDTFAPNATISREEMAVMLIRALEVKQGKKVDAAASAQAFTDASKISSWAASYVDTAANLELVQGKGSNQFDPQGFMTRAESAQVIYKLLAK
ncbi:pullulanase [Paenibacillus sp. YPG26]|uniref:pullulanase n=1 Tax=Paenibacillus sp. YPG26 TaxID=2878915 RepID=UPI00203B0E5A|nr:pullulanase [Paenibacillus sp. YPG26]USB33946.1 pullulanase [Paenibacillus sp. YPG26]